uniref:Uncharacterized protein n=1 Tax=Romanomermis culicivorax TaxID=13658 RepID=A0A915INC2_ROMCU
MVEMMEQLAHYATSILSKNVIYQGLLGSLLIVECVEKLSDHLGIYKNKKSILQLLTMVCWMSSLPNALLKNLKNVKSNASVQFLRMYVEIKTPENKSNPSRPSKRSLAVLSPGSSLSNIR